MAKAEFIITSDCRVKGEHVEKGKIYALDLNVKADTDFIASIAHAGRIAPATKELKEQITAEIEADARRAKALDDAAGLDRAADVLRAGSAKAAGKPVAVKA